jgi:ATP-dependent helicase/nuclease subunit B
VSTKTPFDGPGPRWFTIAADRPFLVDLARGLTQALAPDSLAGATVLLPSRRSVQALAQAFVQANDGRALRLPQVRALGDLEEGEPPFEPGDVGLELPPAISPMRRRFELARLVAENGGLLGHTVEASGALELADLLAGLLDSLEIEEVDQVGRSDRIRGLVEGDLARHWRISADFLTIALSAWEERLAELGLIDVSTRRVRLLRALAEHWTLRPPAVPMIAAGSTGTAPANAHLLTVIARLPMGAVVLPGLDLELADEAWGEVEEQHPQGAMKRLVERARIERADVRPWPGASERRRDRWRRRIVNEALRPAERTADWRDRIRRLKEEGAEAGLDAFAEGLAGLSIVTASAEDEAASAAALLMRETLDTPGKTCALITPDQALARRVSAKLARWGVDADSSAGTPLADAPVGVLAALVARAVTDPEDPVTLLAILKHPLTRLGMEPSELARTARALERYGLRGPRQAGEAWIERRLALEARPRDAETVASEARLTALSDAGRLLGCARAAIGLAAAPYTGGTATPSEAARALAQALERFASDVDGDPGGLWAGPEGEAAAGLISALISDSDGLPDCTPRAFAGLVDLLLEREVVRAGGALHPRLKILGAIESRLISADRLILAGLEEGVWPQAAPTDPFLSRPMRAALGLPPPERRIGLSAHDFAQAACAPEVVLLHCQRRDGAPTVESRWLWRLRTLARGAGMTPQTRPELSAWTAALDAPDGFRPASRPQPCPPVEARPNALPVTAVETWVRDPYAIYARYVLKLRPLERPGESVEARTRGEAVHRALQWFVERYPEALPEDSRQVFQDLLLEALAEAGMARPAMARERALAAKAAPWVVDFERRRRQGARLLVEQKGTLTFEAAGGPFTLSARADRLELRSAGADILDFKTGRPPTKNQVQSGFSPQLTLTAAILQEGGFLAAGPMTPAELVYVQVTGRNSQPEPKPVVTSPDSQTWAQQALDGLKRRVAQFRLAGQPYLSWTAPQYLLQRGGDYDHLARVWEWHVIGEGGEGGE